jgi:hypothetical protein
MKQQEGGFWYLVWIVMEGREEDGLSTVVVLRRYRKKQARA